jgi:TolB protein
VPTNQIAQFRALGLGVLAVAAAAAVVVGAASAFATGREPLFVDVKPLAYGKLTRTVDGVRFSLYLRTRWMNGPLEKIGRKGNVPVFRTHSLLISKSTREGQAAEAVIFWAGFRGGGEATPCAELLPSGADRSRADLAAAVASAPGTKLAGPPRQVRVGGRPATRVVLGVQKDLGCEPGYFFTWPHDPAAVWWGDFWPGTNVGDSIRVWIVDVGRKRLFFEAATKPGHGVEQEITNIIRSIRFQGTRSAALVTAGLEAASAPAVGSRLASSSGRAAPKIAVLSIPRGGGPANATVYVMNADGSGTRRLATKVWPSVPAWSPGGRKLAFVRGLPAFVGGNMEVHVINTDGSGERRLTRNPAADDSPAWSPDGRKIVFVRGHGGGRVRFQSDLYVMNADGRGERRLPHQLAVGGFPVWSPDGREIAFVGNRDGNAEVYVVNADGSGLRNLTRNAAHEDSAVWSPDGRKIAFVRYSPCRDSVCPSDADIYVMNADGSGKRRLTRDAQLDYLPAWSPDGQQVAFERRRRTNPKTAPRLFRREVYVMNADGTGQRLLAYGERPLWSPDGRTIAFVSRRDGDQEDVYVMNADGSAQRNLTRSPAANEGFAWAPWRKR